MASDKRSGMQSNEGIIADTVNADVLAVGKGAQAVKYQINNQVQQEVLAQLDRVIDLICKASSDPGANEILTRDLSGIKTEVQKEAPDEGKIVSLLKGFSDKFTLVKNVFGNASDIIESMKSIASLLKIPLSLIAL